MKTISCLILGLFLLSGCKHGNKKSAETDCEWAKTTFNHDKFQRLQLIRYGFPGEKSEYYWSILDKNYDIGIKYSTGCTISKELLCYNDLMEAEIKKKFGQDFFKMVERKVDSTYSIDKPLIDKVQKLKFVKQFRSLFRYSAFNTSNDKVKVVCGYGWFTIHNKPEITNLFRVSIDRFSMEIVGIDSTKIEVSVLSY